MDNPNGVPQNADINASPSMYSNTLIVSDLFETIQGEAPYAGYHALFLRLAGCNRGRKVDTGCRNCDTAFQLAKGAEHFTRDLATSVARKLQNMAQHSGTSPLLVITGGEPLLQSKALAHFLKGLGESARLLCNVFYVQFETNGDYSPTQLLSTLTDIREYVNVTFVISPKYPNKKLPWYERAYDTFPATVYIRRVVSSNPESPYYDLNPKWFTSPLIFGVYVSPETVYAVVTGQNPIEDISKINWIEYRKNVQRAYELVQKYGARMSVQSHILMGLK